MCDVVRFDQKNFFSINSFSRKLTHTVTFAEQDCVIILRDIHDNVCISSHLFKLICKLVTKHISRTLPSFWIKYFIQSNTLGRSMANP